MGNERTEVKPLVQKIDSGLLELTDEGKRRLSDIVTDTEGPIYAFTSNADPTMVAGSFARLSRSSNGARVVIANEFMDKDGKSDQLLQRVITAFGDDSVMQLEDSKVCIEDVSNIATKKIENGRLAAYLEQSTRYLRFDQKDSDGNYRYVMPEEFDEQTSAAYKEKMDHIFDIYSTLYEETLDHILSTASRPDDVDDRTWHTACHAKACDTIRGLLPAATKATVGMVGSTQAFYNMMVSLESEKLPELRKIGKGVLRAVRAVNPVFFERVDNPNRGGLSSANRAETREATTDIAKKLSGKFPELFENEEGTQVNLLRVDGSENELLAKILSDGSEYSYDQWLSAVSELNDDEKEEVLTGYVGTRENRRVKPGRAFELLQYHFEIVCDFGAFRDIHRHRMVDGLVWQNLSPNLGHDQPQLFSEIPGATELYEEAFSTSKDLYETLQEAGYDEQAQYSTLFGHKMRFNFALNARSLFHSAELRTAVQGHPSYRAIYMDMVEKVKEEHPFVTRYMKFLNTDDNAELARLDAEKAQAEKLRQFDA